MALGATGAKRAARAPSLHSHLLLQMPGPICSSWQSQNVASPLRPQPLTAPPASCRDQDEDEAAPCPDEAPRALRHGRAEHAGTRSLAASPGTQPC